MKRKVSDEHRQFQENWDMECFFVGHRGIPRCLICMDKVADKEYNVRYHYSARHAEVYSKYQEEEQEDRIAYLKNCLLRQQYFFQESKQRE